MQSIINIISSPEQSHSIVVLDVLTVSFDLILLLTAVLAAVFAVRSFRASKRQNELSTVPHLYFDAIGEIQTNQKLYLVNDNNRFAYKFRIDPVYVRHSSARVSDWTYDKYSFKLDFSSTTNKRNFLSQGNQQVPVSIYSNGQKINENEEGFHTWLIRNAVILKTGVWIYFMDVQNLKYFTVMQINADGLTVIKRAPTQYTLLWRIVKLTLNLKEYLIVSWWRLRIAKARVFD